MDYWQLLGFGASLVDDDASMYNNNGSGKVSAENSH